MIKTAVFCRTFSKLFFRQTFCFTVSAFLAGGYHLFLVGILKATDEKSRIWIRIRKPVIRSADPDLYHESGTLFSILKKMSGYNIKQKLAVSAIVAKR